MLTEGQSDVPVGRTKQSSSHWLEDFFFLSVKGSVLMVLIKVQYDAYNRQFTLVDRELAGKLADGETYLLIAEVSKEDFAPSHSAQSGAGTERVMA